ncbi:MAG: PD-(D/E)XK nuclease family protein, partial [Limosilactobacillus sp.]
RRMDKHPLVVLLTALLQIPLHGYQTSDIIQLLKTWLLLPTGLKTGKLAEAVFTTENWCLKQAIAGKGAWTTQDPKEIAELWQVKGTDPQAANYAHSRQKKVNDQLQLIRNFVGQTLIPFFDELKEVRTGRELATKLYQFLVDNGVTKRLNNWQNYQADQGNMDLARRPKQVWATFCQIIEEYVLILGDQQVDKASQSELLTRFSEILQAGFAAAQYSQIPATLDQVVISETGIVQSQSHKVVFMIGATDDVMPEIHDDEGLLTDSDKELLSQYLDTDSQYLPATAVDQLADEPFLNYQGFMSAREQLIISAPQFSADDKELQPSPYLLDTARFFKIAGTVVPLATSPAGQADATPFVSAPLATINQLVQVVRQLSDDQGTKTGEKPQWPASWKQVGYALNKLAEHDDALKERLDVIRRGFAYRNQAEDITAPMAQALYLHTTKDEPGQVLYASISQLQDFYVNQYEYFLKYGLRLRKRDELALSNDRIGTYFHRAMEVFVNLVRDADLSFADLAKDENRAALAEFTRQALDAADQLQPELLRLISSSAQARFQYQQLTAIVKTMLATLCRQAANAHFVPRETEVQFGQINGHQDTDWAPLEYPLDNQHHIQLRGRIDRVDQIDVGNQKYLAVVDYKSGDRLFDLTAAYYGLSLQLLTYLSGLEVNLDRLKLSSANLAGALYLHLSNPTISAGDILKG